MKKDETILSICNEVIEEVVYGTGDLSSDNLYEHFEAATTDATLTAVTMGVGSGVAQGGKALVANEVLSEGAVDHCRAGVHW